MYGHPESEPQEFLEELPPIPDDEFCVYGTVYAHPEHADALEAVYAETTRLAPSEPGTLMYCLGRDTENPTIFYFFEKYAGKAAFDAHNAQPIIKKLLEQDKYIKGVKARFVKAIQPTKQT